MFLRVEAPPDVVAASKRLTLAKRRSDNFYTSLMLMIVLLAFLILPFFSLSLLLLFSIFRNDARRVEVYLFVLLTSVYLASINYTKSPESDLANYFEYFNYANDVGFIEYLVSFGREPGFYSFTYLLKSWFGLDNSVLVFILSFVFYLVIAVSSLRLCELQRIPHGTVFLFLALVLFSPLVFSLSAHLIRQFCAGALLFAYLVSSFSSRRPKTWILIFAVFFHTSIFLFFVLDVIFRWRRKLPFAFIFSLIALFSFAALSPIYMYLEGLVSIPIIGVVFSRILVGTSAHELEPINSQLLVFTFLIFVSCWLPVRNVECPIRKDMMRRAKKFIGILALGVMVLSQIEGFSELTLRYAFYLYFLLPVILCNAFTFFRAPPVFSLSSVMFVFVVFFFGIHVGVWQYLDNIRLLTIATWWPI